MSHDGQLTIAQVIARNAIKHPDKVAFIAPNRPGTTFARFAQRIQALAGALKTRGILPGDRVAILSKNRPEYLEVIGLAAYGYVAVPLNWRLAQEELAYVISDADPKIIFADEASADILNEIADVRSRLCCVFDARREGWIEYSKVAEGTSSSGAIYVERPEATACIVYTSGTTGRPKGAELTHRGLTLISKVTNEEILKLREDDVALCPMPLFHVGGLWYHAFPSFYAGCTSVILPEFRPEEVLSAIAEHRVTNMHVVPTMLHGLKLHLERAPIAITSLRLIYYAGSSMPLSVLKESMASFPACDFIQGYGSTEAGVVAFLSAEDHRCAVADDVRAHLLSSCGRVCSHVELTLLDSWIDENGFEMGEIGVSSPFHMSRYWRNPTSTTVAFANRFLRIGDIGRRDDKGYIYILDRKNDMIVTGGENVYPSEVESVLLDDPAVMDAAVFDVADPKWVQKVVAAVVLRPEVKSSAEEIIARARLRLSGYKSPKSILFVSHLPRNPAGKVLRRTLRLMASEAKDLQS